MNEKNPQIFTREDGETIAYHKLSGCGPGVVFLHGLISSMEGTKAKAMEDYCRRTGRAFLRFDTYGHGRSSGTFTQGTIGRWAEDTVAMLDALTDGPQVLIGSSMGGWTMLLAALQRPERIHALMGIAPSPDFSEDLMWARFTEEQRRLIMTDGILEEPNDYSDEPYRISKVFIEDARDRLLLRSPIPITCPVRILQGLADKDVPWQTALKLADCLDSEDVTVTLIKGGGHSLSEPEDIRRMETVLERLILKN